MRGLRWMAAALCFCLLPLAAAEHHGVVTFGGLPLPGALVTATQGDKTVTAVTDGNGAYSFPDLADGVWTIKVEMQTFAPQTKEVAVAADAPSPQWDMKMLALSEMQATAAPAAPPAGAAAPQTAANSPTAAAPGNGAANPPAAPANGKKGKGKNAAAAAPQQTGGFQRAEVNAAAGNGASTPADQITPVDAAGASDSMVVNGSVSNGIERRAIGNARRGPGSLFRGDLMFVLDNSALNARQFSITGQNTAQPAYNHLRYGGSFGGPLIIPHLLHGNGQFFISYQGGRNRNASISTNTVPTDAMRDGDFSQVTNRLGQVPPVIDPLTGNPFPGNVIPQSRFSSQALALLKFYPEPNFIPTAGYNYQVGLLSVNSSDDLQSRINKTLSRKDFLFGNFGYHNQRGNSDNIYHFVDNNDNAGINANANWRHMFNQRVNSSFGLSYSRYSARGTPYFETLGQNVSGDAGITGNNQDPINYGPPNLSFGSGIASLSDSTPYFVRNQTVAFSYTGLWVHRPHNVTYGADIRRQEFNSLSQQNPRGSFQFNGTAAGNDFAGFLLGIPDASSIAFGNADKYFRSGMYDAYFTDDWRVAAGFTLNWGVRWEYGSPITEKYGRLVNLDVAPGFTAVSPVIGNSPVGTLTGQKYPESLVNPDKHAFQPRIAFSWHPLFGSTLVVRGGYGVYYNTSVYQQIANQMAQQSPLSKSLSIANGPLSPLTLANGFNGAPGVTPNTFGIDPNFRVGFTQSWQLSVQRDLTEGIVMTVTYLGIKGARGAQLFVPNTYPLGVTSPCPTCPSGFTYMTSNGNSTREAGSVGLVRRFHNGFSANLLYTYSKAIDDAVIGGNPSGGRQTASSFIAQNWLDLSAERSLSNFDQRHLVTFATQYTTGVGVRGGTLLSGWRGQVFKGWTVVTSINAGTGFPITPSFPGVLGRTGVGALRPDYTGASLYDGPPGLYLNPAAFSAPLPGQWGTAGRNFITGPNTFTLNSSMARTFQETLDIRFDATNTLNHVTYPGWNAVYNSPQFGLPTGANAMRLLQLTARWRF